MTFLFYVFASVHSLSLQAQTDDQPNIIIIFADDLGYGDVGDEPITHDLPELYNLVIDSSERFNIVFDHPEVLEKIMNLVREREVKLVRREDQLEPVREDVPVPWQE